MPPRRRQSKPPGSALSKGQLTAELLTLGAEHKFKDLLRQLQQLRLAYPAIAARLDADAVLVPMPSSNNGDQALQMFRKHKQATTKTKAHPRRHPWTKEQHRKFSETMRQKAIARQKEKTE